MTFEPQEILIILDRCSDAFTFPMLDNGYIYLAATRLSLYRSPMDWAIVIEVFGFSPRAGSSGTCIQTFASRLHDRDRPEQYVSQEAYNGYLVNKPHNDARFVFPIHEGAWQDAEDAELVAEEAQELFVRHQRIRLPSIEEYASHGILLEIPPRVKVFEICRFLAEVAREQVLATNLEQRISVLPEMRRILQLEQWHHPNLAENERPSESEAFQQLAQVLASGETGLYRPSRRPNSHWRNWPDAGRL